MEIVGLGNSNNTPPVKVRKRVPKIIKMTSSPLVVFYTYSMNDMKITNEHTMSPPSIAHMLRPAWHSRIFLCENMKRYNVPKSIKMDRKMVKLAVQKNRGNEHCVPFSSHFESIYIITFLYILPQKYFGVSHWYQNVCDQERRHYAFIWCIHVIRTTCIQKYEATWSYF